MGQVRVVSENRGVCRIWTESGEQIARLAPRFFREEIERPVTGDWAWFEPSTGLLTDLLPRHSRITRKRAGKALAEQVLAANVDVAFVVSGLDGDFNPRRLERYRVMLHATQVETVLVLNKGDLCEDILDRLSEVDAVATGCPVIVMSALAGDGVHQLHRYVESGQTAVLLGSSGAGKSTIVNQLLGVQAQPVGPVREADSRGRHTTTGRELFRLDQGWMVIDTPGLRELEPWVPPEAVSGVFADIETLAAACRFGDCTHSNEPGCAVRDAVGRGRLESYHKLLRAAAYQASEADPLLARARKERWKRIHREQHRIQRE